MNAKCHQHLSIVAEFSMSKIQAKSDITSEVGYLKMPKIILSEISSSWYS